MSGSRAQMPQRNSTVRQLSKLSFRFRWMKRRFLGAIGRGEPRVRIPLHQTAELEMVPTIDRSRLEPQVFNCPSCTKRDGVDTKLLMIELQTRKRGRIAGRRSGRKRHPSAKVLLRVTRQQIDDIQAEFAKPGPKPGKPQTDRGTVLESLVP
jgi:hypothetical protein